MNETVPVESEPGAKVVPEKYEFKSPVEGQTYPDALIDKATPIFKELGLDQAQADKLIGVWNDLSQGNADLAVKAVKDMRAVWAGETETALGAKGDALVEKLAPIGAMKDAIFADNKAGREAFESAMDLTGAGDHPAIVMSMLKIATRFAEGKHVSGSGPSPLGQTPTGQPVRKTAAQSMYPNLPSSNAA